MIGIFPAPARRFMRSRGTSTNKTAGDGNRFSISLRFIISSKIAVLCKVIDRLSTKKAGYDILPLLIEGVFKKSDNFLRVPITRT